MDYLQQIDKACIESTRFSINKYFDRIDIFDKTNYKFIVSIKKETIKNNIFILKLL